MRLFSKASQKIWLLGLAIAVLSVAGSQTYYLESSSHREAPLIANDPQADNTDVYAFRSPTNPDNMIIIANYIPFQLPHGGPNYYWFGEDVTYDIHIKNNPETKGDDIIYRFEFKRENEDPSTFFRARLGKENSKNTYTMKKSTDGGHRFTTVLSNGKVPPPNIGPRSIQSGVGLGASDYESLMMAAITTAPDGEKIFAGQIDDPFFVDLGGIFDLGNIRPENAPDGLRCLNVHTIAMEIPIRNLQKDGKSVREAKNILDSDYVIGVWASASRRKITVRTGKHFHDLQGPLVQVSRLGMPLTNEVINPVGRKDEWNNKTPYNEGKFWEEFFVNPELALYMDDERFGTAVPGLSQLRIQSRSLGRFDFRNLKDGLYQIRNSAAVRGTALDRAAFGEYLLRPRSPRSVDLLPIFHTGVPNLPPYQLATGKGGNPLAMGKPFINNFLPTFGDMLRVNMAVPVTDRNSADFSSLGLVQAAVLGLTDDRYNTNTDIQFIPNMDGFPNGRRLEDDVTRIELQAVGGVVLAAIGLWYDDFEPGTSPSPVTQDLVNVLTFTTGVEKNDTTFKAMFPFVQTPWNGFKDGAMCNCGDMGTSTSMNTTPSMSREVAEKMAAPTVMTMSVETYPNPTTDRATFRYRVAEQGKVSLKVYDMAGREVAAPVNNVQREAGDYEVNLDVSNLKEGVYFVAIQKGTTTVQTQKFVIKK